MLINKFNEVYTGTHTQRVIDENNYWYFVFGQGTGTYVKKIQS